MTAKWFITRRAKTDGPAALKSIKNAPVGPLPATKLLELASTGDVAADDLVQLDGTDVLITLAQFLSFALAGRLPDFEANAALATSNRQPISSPATALPDWLDDVVKAETPRPPRPPFLPDWLEDMCRSEKLLLDSRAHQTTVAEVALDWLDDIRQIEESLRLRPAPRPEAPPSTKAFPPSTPALTPLAQPTAPPPARVAPPQPAPEQPKQHSFDPETGRILDPVAYALFQKAQARRRLDEQQTQPTLSVAEVFLDAQRALQGWVDDPANRALVTIGDMEPIRQCASVKALLARYAGYGSVMQDKLCKRLALLVENRRKFVKAFCRA